jgi:hypothetical protein
MGEVWIISGCDQNVDHKEWKRIIGYISRYKLYLRRILEEIVKSRNLRQIFMQETVNILIENPSERDSMFDYLLDSNSGQPYK